jgi:hypothetical protein
MHDQGELGIEEFYSFNESKIGQKRERCQMAISSDHQIVFDEFEMRETGRQYVLGHIYPHLDVEPLHVIAVLDGCQLVRVPGQMKRLV